VESRASFVKERKKEYFKKKCRRLVALPVHASIEVFRNKLNFATQNLRVKVGNRAVRHENDSLAWDYPGQAWNGTAPKLHEALCPYDCC